MSDKDKNEKNEKQFEDLDAKRDKPVSKDIVATLRPIIEAGDIASLKNLLALLNKSEPTCHEQIITLAIDLGRIPIIEMLLTMPQLRDNSTVILKKAADKLVAVYTQVDPAARPAAEVDAIAILHKLFNKLYYDKMPELEMSDFHQTKVHYIIMGIHAKKEKECKNVFAAIASGKQDINFTDLPINAANKKGQTFLMLAAGQGSLTLVDKLLAEGASSNNKCKAGLSAVDYASMADHMDIIKLLVKANDFTPQLLTNSLFRYVQNKNYKGLKMLLQLGATLAADDSNICEQNTRRLWLQYPVEFQFLKDLAAHSPEYGHSIFKGSSFVRDAKKSSALPLPKITRASPLKAVLPSVTTDPVTSLPRVLSAVDDGNIVFHLLFGQLTDQMERGVNGKKLFDAQHKEHRHQLANKMYTKVAKEATSPGSVLANCILRMMEVISDEYEQGDEEGWFKSAEDYANLRNLFKEYLDKKKSCGDGDPYQGDITYIEKIDQQHVDEFLLWCEQTEKNFVKDTNAYDASDNGKRDFYFCSIVVAEAARTLSISPANVTLIDIRNYASMLIMPNRRLTGKEVEIAAMVFDITVIERSYSFQGLEQINAYNYGPGHRIICIQKFEERDYGKKTDGRTIFSYDSENRYFARLDTDSRPKTNLYKFKPEKKIGVIWENINPPISSPEKRIDALWENINPSISSEDLFFTAADSTQSSSSSSSLVLTSTCRPQPPAKQAMPEESKINPIFTLAKPSLFSATLPTYGDGNCAFHAIFGKVSNAVEVGVIEPKLYDEHHKEHRMQLANAVKLQANANQDVLKKCISTLFGKESSLAGSAKLLSEDNHHLNMLQLSYQRQQITKLPVLNACLTNPLVLDLFRSYEHIFSANPAITLLEKYIFVGTHSKQELTKVLGAAGLLEAHNYFFSEDNSTAITPAHIYEYQQVLLKNLPAFSAEISASGGVSFLKELSFYCNILDCIIACIHDESAQAARGARGGITRQNFPKLHNLLTRYKAQSTKSDLAWVPLRAAIESNRAIQIFISQQCVVHPMRSQKPGTKDQFIHMLNYCKEAFLAKLSEQGLFALYKTYQDMSRDDSIALITPDHIVEYANILGRSGRYLSAKEVELIAQVFDITIIYNVATNNGSNTIQSAVFNPSSKQVCSIRHDGVNHFEAMNSDSLVHGSQEPLQSFSQQLSSSSSIAAPDEDSFFYSLVGKQPPPRDDLEHRYERHTFVERTKLMLEKSCLPLIKYLIGKLIAKELDFRRETGGRPRFLNEKHENLLQLLVQMISYHQEISAVEETIVTHPIVASYLDSRSIVLPTGTPLLRRLAIYEDATKNDSEGLTAALKEADLLPYHYYCAELSSLSMDTRIKFSHIYEFMVIFSEYQAELIEVIVGKELTKTQLNALHFYALFLNSITIIVQRELMRKSIGQPLLLKTDYFPHFKHFNKLVEDCYNNAKNISQALEDLNAAIAGNAQLQAFVDKNAKEVSTNKCEYLLKNHKAAFIEILKAQNLYGLYLNYKKFTEFNFLTSMNEFHLKEYQFIYGATSQYYHLLHGRVSIDSWYLSQPFTANEVEMAAILFGITIDYKVVKGDQIMSTALFNPGFKRFSICDDGAGHFQSLAVEAGSGEQLVRASESAVSSSSSSSSSAFFSTTASKASSSASSATSSSSSRRRKRLREGQTRPDGHIVKAAKKGLG